mmetsp:Transcript_23125/g.75392  ORF Transcript_23125/g.75392 Transcript_23125/m.75392 type:complete len:235 (-) Transcript_23125:762-1466(-)
MVLSKTSLVAPALSATAMPCIISGPSTPTMWQPITLSVATSTRSFMNIRCELPEMVFFIGRKLEVYTSTSPYSAIASSSVRPTVATGGCEKTAHATPVWSGLVGLSWKSVLARHIPSCSATGVRLMRSVTSPMACTLSHVVFEYSSTLIAPDSLSSTPAASRLRNLVLGLRPVANIAASASNSPPLVLSLIPSPCFSTASGVSPGCRWMPLSASCSATNCLTSSSKPRSGSGWR